ncbi:MAG: PKD domain-containing protein, partial [Burkholderiales bacterium]|nr:PKD domain-containing protein [Anaerolineae bacterium]
SQGLEGNAQTLVSVNAPAVAPQVSISANPPSGEAPLPVQFNSQIISGDAASYAWDFGDGGTSSDPNPQYVYNTPGDYNVTLTVVSAQGQQGSAQTTVSVSAPADIPLPPGIVDTTPALPNLGPIQNRLRGIYDAGQGLGNRASAFTFVGDEQYLTVFADPNNYQFEGNASLQEAVDWFSLAPLSDGTSFQHDSDAIDGDWQADDLLDPNDAGGDCSDGETPIACELRLTQPSVVFIVIGYNDIDDGTDPAEFTTYLQQIVDTAVNSGVIPVLMTVQPRPDAEEQTRLINETIINVANANQVPVYNLWRAISDLPDPTMSTSPGGPGDLTSGAIANYGVNLRNFHTLTILDMLHDTIFPDAAPPA